MRNRLTLVAAVTLLTLSAPGFGGNWTIPGTVNAGGLNNTRFVSDLALTNPGSVPAQVLISFIPANGTSPAFVMLNPAETIVYRNVLDSLWGAQGAGATRVNSDSPLLIRARTYNASLTGTYGVALPVFPDERLLSLGDTADSLWISQSADGGSGYRTNVAVVFPDDGGGAATVTVYGADGSKAGSQDFSFDAPGFQQFGVGGFAGAVSIARAQVKVTRGRAAGYSVVVDNVTGDSSLFAFEDLPAGAQDVLVNGVARANGRNNTFFRTDGRFYNSGASDATVSVAFHDNKNSNPSPLTRTFTVPAGQIRDVVDVLNALLGLPVGSAGALRFTSDAPVAILCRTSNVDPLGVKPGTFGAQQKPTPLLSFLMSADAGAVVTGIRQNATFRTNVGFAAGGDGAGYTLTLESTSGDTVATSAASLGAFGWTQPNVADLFPGTPIPEDATLLVRVTSGSVDVFDSSIDNASGDPVVTPIMPLPEDIPSAATIGPQGGSIRSEDGRFTLKVPAGALAAPAAFSLVAVANTAPNGHGSGYVLSPGAASFSRSARVVLSYDKTTLFANAPVGPNLAFQSGGSWYAVTRSSVDASARTVSASIPATSPAAVSPAAAARGGRRATLDAGTAWASLYAVDLVPPTRVVLSGSSLDLRVSIIDIKAGDPTPYVLVRNKDLSGYAFDWYVNTVLRGNPLAGSIEGSGASVTYRAPAKEGSLACIPSENPVLIQVFFADRAAAGPKTDFLKARVGVLARNWSFDYGLKRNVTCGSLPILTPISFGYGSQVNATFTIGEDMTVGSLQKAGSGLLRVEAGTCYGDCSYTMGPIRTIDLVGLEGSSFVDSGDPYAPLHLKFQLQDPGDPSFTIVCPHTPVVIKPESDVTLLPREIRVSVAGGQIPLSSFSFDTETVLALPLTPKCE
ncbi:MAG TPA: hypothetical protein VF554_12635 [Thermoanaerobaculia bacterium]